MDNESKEYISNIIERSIFNRFLKKLEHANVVIISDYKKGMFTRSLLKKIIDHAHQFLAMLHQLYLSIQKIYQEFYQAFF